MLHLATSSPCSRSEIYAFDNKSNQKNNPSTICRHLLKDRHPKINSECDLFNMKASSSGSISGSCRLWECCGKADQMSTGGRCCRGEGGWGKRSGKCGAYFNQCARGKKTEPGQTGKPKAVNVKG
uniref:(northern house mosquito) hypothetical protein n=1 Tax=Culex pipiens TaxID=7175 RepID=A0A8D8CM15_CULPI